MAHIKLIVRLLAMAALAIGATVARAAAPVPEPDEAIAASVTVGQAEWLTAAGERFLGLYTPASTGAPLGAAIILPGLGLHPDWPDVIAPLRTGLPGYGWSTLSIALPTPARGSDGKWQLEPYYTASRARIQAAIAFLDKQGITEVALIGQGLGAAAGAVNVSGSDALRVVAFAAISLGVPADAAPSLYRPGLVAQIRVPTLDIFGSRDLDEVTDTAAARLTAARRGGLDTSADREPMPARPAAEAAGPASRERHDHIAFRQFQVAGADHRFRGAEPTLLRRIAGWLKSQAGPVLTAGTAE